MLERPLAGDTRLARDRPGDALLFARTVECVGFERFQGAGHYLHHERPTELVLKLSDFLDKLQARPAQLSVRRPIVAPTRSWELSWAALLEVLIPRRIALYDAA